MRDERTPKDVCGEGNIGQVIFRTIQSLRTPYFIVSFIEITYPWISLLFQMNLITFAVWRTKSLRVIRIVLVECSVTL